MEEEEEWREKGRERREKKKKVTGGKLNLDINHNTSVPFHN